VNTFQWFKDHVYYLDESYDPTDRIHAFSKALEQDPFPLGVIYKHVKPSFEAEIGLYLDNQTPLVKRRHDMNKLQKLIDNS
jgi:2-oxoglutarate ferredoxin oxidoreductase subunit beta